jgi:hypothetical protein
MSMETFTDMEIASQQASRGKGGTRQLALRRYRRTQARRDTHQKCQHLIGLNTLHTRACKAWASRVPSPVWMLGPATRPKPFLAVVPPFSGDGDIDGQWCPQNQTNLVFGILDDACPSLVAQFHGMPDGLEPFNIRHAGHPEVTAALNLRLFTTESHGALLEIATQWENADGTTLRE